VGGLADVVRDAPLTLAEHGWAPLVLTPAYGRIDEFKRAQQVAALEVPFRGRRERVDIYEIEAAGSRVRYQLADHPAFAPWGPGPIYCADPASEPFATDASKFALLSATAATLALHEPQPDVVHLHDWHSALYLVLRAFDPAYAPLRGLRTVLTIHNLAFQGIRPFEGHASSLRAWFPDLIYRPEIIGDPRHRDCVNPLAAGIRLADRVHTVSPSYAEEIQRPSDPARGFSGGEGLESDLAAAAAQQRLFGILNGCVYPPRRARRPSWKEFLRLAQVELLAWAAARPAVASAHFLADKRLGEIVKRRPPALLTSVGRITEQKVRLFCEPTHGGDTALEAILGKIGDALCIMLGNGDPRYEQVMTKSALQHPNFLFLPGYSEQLADSLYALGDLFLMPSSFEPCGISQMLAMRAGQPCVVHAVGGLKDTVTPERGFRFDGDSPREQAERFVATVLDALELRQHEPDRWEAKRVAAASVRFSWDHAITTYERCLYA
jgi:starch synthase